MRAILTSYVISAILLLFIVGCESGKETPTNNTINLKSCSKEYHIVTSAQESKAIRIANYYGGVIIIGWSKQDSIGIFMYKSIKAGSENVALNSFDNIQYQVEKVVDSLQLTISTPASTDQLRYYCSLCLFIPYSMVCKITYNNGPVFVDQLDSELIILNSADRVQVQRHNASCEITSSFSIDAQVNMPYSGRCCLYTKSGGIELSIPSTTSCVVTAICTEGYVNYSNLNFVSLVMSENYLSGTIGNGSSTVILKADKGNIEIKGF